MTKRTIGRRTAVAVLVLIVSSWVPGRSAAMHSSESCKRAEGEWLDSLDDAGGTNGVITNAGILNGTTQTVYSPAFVFTPDPNVVAYTAETTISTNHGRLVTSNVYLYNFVTGLGTAMGRINPATSTGQFTGATGVLYFNLTETIGVPPAQSYASTITGEVCLAH